MPLPSGRPGAAAEFDTDYTYIRSDLRRIALLAGTFVILLVAASFLVP
jgi:hypothetical protein